MGAAQGWKHRPGDGDVAEDVDVELPTQILLAEELQRSADADPGVVDQGIEAGGAEPGGLLADLLDRRGDLPLSVTSSASGTILPAGAPSARRSPAAGSRTPARTVQPESGEAERVARPIPRRGAAYQASGTPATLAHTCRLEPGN